MVNKSPALDVVFGALADATRRQMLDRLAMGPASVGELGAPHAMTKGAISKHVKVLERAGFVRRTVEGRVHRLDLEPAPLAAAEAWVERIRGHWQEQLDHLETYLAALQASRGRRS